MGRSQRVLLSFSITYLTLKTQCNQNTLIVIQKNLGCGFLNQVGKTVILLITNGTVGRVALDFLKNLETFGDEHSKELLQAIFLCILGGRRHFRRETSELQGSGWTVLGRVAKSVQSLSHVQLFVTPWTVACQDSLSITSSRNLLNFMSIESTMPSN